MQSYLCFHAPTFRRILLCKPCHDNCTCVFHISCVYLFVSCSASILQNADLAVAPMTINFARESVIDFTKPFMNLGIQILFKLPSGMPVKLFSFMSPLDTYIWMYVLCAYVLVSCTMFLVARFSPYEWKDPHPCVKESGLMENQFSLGELITNNNDQY